MGRSKRGRLWIDHIVAIGVALSLALAFWLGALPLLDTLLGGPLSWWLFGGLAAVWLMWRVWRRVKRRR